MEKFSDYIVYVDESGDHSLVSIDKNYPIFVLVFCIFQKKSYANSISPEIQKLKFKHFGHDMTILHESEIRKATNDFKFLINKEKREIFYEDLNNFIQNSTFTVISIVIEKEHLTKKYSDPANPYNLAMQFGLERVFSYVQDHQEDEKILHIVVESRGKKEDKDLELEFRRVCEGNNKWTKQLPFKLIFANKQSNAAGLQLADLVARPVGLNILKPNQQNRAYDIIENKFYKKNGKIEGFGLKKFPS